MLNKPKFTLLQGISVYSPNMLGIKDVLFLDNKIISIQESFDVQTLTADSLIIPLHGYILTPGFIDQHVHLTGGGGEGSFNTRVPAVILSDLTTAGVTTAIGLLGTDNQTRGLGDLFGKVKGLNQDGITAYMLSGSYIIPPVTITESIDKDIIFIDPVIGLKVAISDHRASSPTIDELCRIISLTQIGGMLSGKAGNTVFHLGDGKRGLQPIFDILEQSDIFIEKLLPTHVSRNMKLFDQAIEFALMGGSIDITTTNIPCKNNTRLTASQAVSYALEKNVPITRIMLSSDGNGSVPVFNEHHEIISISQGKYTSLLVTIKELVQRDQLPLSDALKLLTSNVADYWKLNRKGRIQEGYDADLLVFDQDLNLHSVFAKGVQMVDKGKVCVKGFYEQ